MMPSWNDVAQTVAITGGSRGIGLEIARKLASSSDPNKVKFLLISKQSDLLEYGRRSMERSGYPYDSIRTFRADLANMDDIKAVMKV